MSATGAVSADVGVDRGRFSLRAAFEIPAGGRVAVLGPNGAGKSTLLDAIAGHVPLARGEIRFDGEVIERAGSVRLRPEQRHIGRLDQKPRLFPHLSAAQNIAFGPRVRGEGRASAARIAHDWLVRVGLGDRAGARPHELSGGQQQRVAIARTFAAAPRLLLLDEPFAALDVESAPAVRALLADELGRTQASCILVTHDLADAWQLADHCVVLQDGQVVERGAPADLATRPTHPFTARLAGFSVVDGRWDGETLDAGEGIRIPGTSAEPFAQGTAACALISPADAVLVAGPESGSFPMRLDAVSSTDGVLRLENRCGLRVMVPVSQVLGASVPRVGEIVHVRVSGARIERPPRS